MNVGNNYVHDMKVEKGNIKNKDKEKKPWCHSNKQYKVRPILDNSSALRIFF